MLPDWRWFPPAATPNRAWACSREGWDVRNVCVIVTLRPLSAANRILPEQALGRHKLRSHPKVAVVPLSDAHSTPDRS